MVLASLLLGLSLFAQESSIPTTTTIASDDVTTISGVIVAVRTNPVTEVFVRGAKHSVVIPPGAGHNELLQKVIEKQKSGGSMSFTVDAKSHRVIPAKAPAASSSPGSMSEENSSK